MNLQPFKDTESENIEEFFRQIGSCLQVAGIHDDNNHQYLHLHSIPSWINYQMIHVMTLNKQSKHSKTAVRMTIESKFINLYSSHVNSFLQMNKPKIPQENFNDLLLKHTLTFNKEQQNEDAQQLQQKAVQASASHEFA